MPGGGKGRSSRHFDERLAEALVQAGAALLIGVRRRLPLVHADQSSGPRTPGARPIHGERSVRRGAGGRLAREARRSRDGSRDDDALLLSALRQLCSRDLGGRGYGATQTVDPSRGRL